MALKDIPDEEPEMPQDIVTVRIDPHTGAQATAATEGAIFEMFRAENAPGGMPAAPTARSTWRHDARRRHRPGHQDLF